ncbi:mastermind-like protein 1 isoform X2 [Kryptolebias marmoratus]|uniref:Mastermind-like transcriptional coactivator 1 n=3 Tax=Kryptolebias marmoratus TaxID=37003 RepID=A0A3Q3BQ07_KRYMA|nr:mastermind-like protein 1 isoform X2 [Kryptolebias marmoratus]
MERLRHRIELLRQRHNRCESRYDSATQERMELEKQQTLSLHQRLLQTKAKRASKHRQPQPSGEQAGQRAPGGGAEPGEGGGTAAEQSRNRTLMALQETLKRKPDSTSSPVNGFSDGFPPNKKISLDNRSPLDSKSSLSDSSNQTHVPTGELGDGGGEPDFHCSKLKQEPEDILPIMPPLVGGSNNLFPDLNEQEWKELMEDLNRSVPIEDIQKILEESLEDRKDSSELALTPGGAGGAAGDGGQSSQGLLPDLASVKTEFSPPSAVFEQDTRTTSPHMKSTSSVQPPHPNSSPVASSSASSPALPPPQPAPPSRPLQPPPNHLLPPGPPGPKDLSPAQQLQQLAAQQQRVQNKMKHKQPQREAKFLNQGPHGHPQAWPQMTNSSQTSLGVTGSSLYPSDFNPNAQKSLMMPPQHNKSSPKSGAGSYMQGSAGHPNILSPLTSGPPLSHPPTQGAQAPTARLNYNNTRPLSHYEAGPGPPRPPNTTSQDKTLLNLVRQQQQLKQNSMTFSQHNLHTQDQNSYPTPANVLPSGPGGNPLAASQGVNAMAGNRNAVYQNNQAAMAAALKQQQQLLEHQKKQQYLQRQQLMAEQEKQRQQQEQQQQLQRHLTRPPPQYQDQPGPPANQNPFPQQPVSQFTASSQPMSSVGSMGGPAPSARMFSQNQGMMGMNMGQGGGPGGGVAPPPAVSQADISLPSCSGGGDGAGVDGLYNNMNLHPAHSQQPTGLQHQSLGPMSAPYRQNLLPQQHLKPQTSALLKQQQLAARLPNAMQGNMGANMTRSMQTGQNAAWQQQLASQTPTGNAFNNPSNAFHLQQPRIPKMPSGSAPFGANAGGRPMAALNAGQPMMQTNMAAAQQRAPPTPQGLGQPMANQQQAQQQQANQSLPDLAAFGQPQANGHQGLQCNQGYQVSRTANQQQVSFGYNMASGSFAAESDLVDSLLKSQSTQEWMADLDELLASHP